MIDRLYFDIETGPQSYRVIEEIIAYEDDETPKLGNAKKPETIARKKQEWEENKNQRRKQHYGKVYSKAALNPLIGQVVGVGYYRESYGDAVIEIDLKDEATIIEDLVKQMGDVFRRGGLVITYNGDAFDLPFLANRCAILGININGIIGTEVFNEFGKTPNSFVDLAKVWLRYGSGYNRSFDLPKFDELCAAFGIPAKTCGFRGDRFHQVAREDESLARDYLLEDVQALRELAGKLLPNI
jgi:hypothetical protein